MRGFTLICSLAEANAADMLTVQPPGNGPYVLGGHSYGGAVAVEIALLLESWGHEVGLVLVSSPFCLCTYSKELDALIIMTDLSV